MQTIHEVNIFSHVLFGSAALLVGLITILTNRNTQRHRRYGHWFLRLLSVVVATALIGVVLFRPNPVLILLTMLSSYLGYSGYQTIRNRDRRANRRDIYLALAMTLASIGYGYAATQSATNWSPVVIYATLSALLLVTAYDFMKQVWLFERLRNGWLYEHIYKMLAAYSAILSAFTGTVLPQYFPYSQVGPSIGCLVLFAYFVIRRSRKPGWSPPLVFLPLAILMISPNSAVAQSHIGDRAVPFTLTDQYGKTTKLAVPPPTVTILTFADRAGAPLLREWLTSLPTDGSAQVLSVACTGWVPFFVKELVTKEFRKSKPILIDWNNKVANQYGLDDTGCLLVKINEKGIVTALGKGKLTPVQLNQFTKQVPKQ